jgi:hypothetical protein
MLGMDFKKWELFLIGARFYEHGDPRAAEDFYNRACAFAEVESGLHSAAVGSVVLDFAYFLEDQGRDSEAQCCYKRLRGILSLYLDTLGTD